MGRRHGFQSGLFQKSQEGERLPSRRLNISSGPDSQGVFITKREVAGGYAFFFNVIPE
jgi:hypothetical protein